MNQVSSASAPESYFNVFVYFYAVHDTVLQVNGRSSCFVVVNNTDPPAMTWKRNTF